MTTPFTTSHPIAAGFSAVYSMRWVGSVFTQSGATTSQLTTTPFVTFGETMATVRSVMGYSNVSM